MNEVDGSIYINKNAAAFNAATYTDPFSSIKKSYAYDKNSHSFFVRGLIKLESLVEKLAGEVLLFYATVFEGATKFNSNSDAIKRVFDRIVKASGAKDYNFSIRIASSSSSNAFCLPGGKIFITRGMVGSLKKRDDLFNPNDYLNGLTFEDKLASVLGHEVAHAAEHHILKRGAAELALSILGNLVKILLPMFAFSACKHNCLNAKDEKSNKIFLNKIIDTIISLLVGVLSRKQELQADYYGTIFAAKAGYNPRASIWLQHYLLEKTEDRREDEPRQGLYKLYFGFTDYINSHPSSGKRLQENRKTLDKIVHEGLDAKQLLETTSDK